MKRLIAGIRGIKSTLYLWLLAPQYLKRDSHDRHGQLIETTEREVFGDGGIVESEAHEVCELRRLVRRTLAQFLCQRKLIGSPFVLALRQSVYGVSVLPLLATLVWRSWRDRHNSPNDAKRHGIVVFFLAERLKESIGPNSFPEEHYLLRKPSVRLGLAEISFLLRTVFHCPRFLRYPELLVNAIRWTCYYGFVVRNFAPHTVVHFFESTASSSLMTAYLHQFQIRHIDIQHGERWHTADAAFSAFDEIHVWGEYFRNVFVWQKSHATAILVKGHRGHDALYNDIRPRNQPRRQRLLIIDPYIYGRQTYDYDALVRVLYELDSSWDVRIRRHPFDRREELECLEALQSETSLSDRGITIVEEPPSEVSIHEALASTRVVIGITSAAMIDSWIAGCKVIHLPSVAAPQGFMLRYQESHNVWYADDTEGVGSFLREPVELSDDEAGRIDYVTRVLPPSRDNHLEQPLSRLKSA